jgi:hypothetical protein
LGPHHDGREELDDTGVPVATCALAEPDDELELELLPQAARPSAGKATTAMVKTDAFLGAPARRSREASASSFI